MSVPPPFSPSAAGRGTMPEHGNRAPAIGRGAGPRTGDISGLANEDSLTPLLVHAQVLQAFLRSNAALSLYLFKKRPLRVV